MSYLITGEFLKNGDKNNYFIKKLKNMCKYRTNKEIKDIGKKLAIEVRKQRKKNKVVEKFASEVTDAICDLNTIKGKIEDTDPQTKN